ncbi:hypothetical protein GGR52DRAFT_148359 [Hypoxylon sp. FL1284]|nr:hypothetical protein GGR52DRAFT_148359 [Hypoxylon sp. FL1284]
MPPANPRRFQETLESLPKSLEDVLTSYSGVPKDEQVEHVLKVRNEAYEYFPYPCLGMFRFVNLDLAAHYAYEDHVRLPLQQPVPDGATEPLFLDLGTCFGQDVRKLVYDGARVERLWASDIEPKFIELGFELFKDAHKLPNDHFLCPGNLLSDLPDDRLRQLYGKVTILHMTAVFHLFSLQDQKRAADRCLRLLRKDTGGPVLLLGSQVGSTVPGPYQGQNISSGYTHKYRHDGQTWAELWQEVCGGEEWKEKVKKVETTSKLLGQDQKKDPESGKLIEFTEAEPGSTMAWQMFEVWVTFA